MNLKELIIFGIENSQEPEIKNPVLRAALEGPRTMAQEPRNMAQGGQIIGKPGGLVEPGVEYYSTSKVYNEKTGHIYPGGNKHKKWWSDKPGRNKLESIKTPQVKEKVKKFIIDNPDMNQKEGAKILGRKQAELVPADQWLKPGKKRKKDPTETKKRARAVKIVKSSESMLAEMAGKEGHHLSHLSLTQLDSLQNLGYLPKDINIKSYHSFEKKIVANAKEIYAAQNNKSLSIPERRAEIAKLQKIDRTLRKEFPQYANIKARLKVQATKLDPSGVMIKEIIDPKIAISQEAGTTLKGVTPATEKGQDLLKLSKKSLEAKIKELGGKNNITKLLANGTATGPQKKILREIIGTGAVILKGTGKVLGNLLNPKEFFRLRNLVGPEAMAFMVGIEAGIIGYDVINNNTPIKQALGANWVTSWTMPRTLEEYEIEEMRDKGYLSSVSSERFAKSQEMVNDLNRDYAEIEFLKKGKEITGRAPSESIAEKQKAYDAKEQDYFSFLGEGKGMDPYEFEKDRGRMLEERGAGYSRPEVEQGRYKTLRKNPLANEYGYVDVADETKLKSIRDFLGLEKTGWFEQGTPQKKDVRILDERLPPQLGGETSLLKMPKFDLDLTKYESLPSDYRDRKHEKLTEQDIEGLTNYYRAIGKLKEDEELEDMFYEDTEKSMLEEAQIANKWRQLYGSPGMQGSQDPYAEGGLASLKKW
jgi:hypothetical protein